MPDSHQRRAAAAHASHGTRSIKRSGRLGALRALSTTLSTASAMPNASESRNAGRVKSSGVTFAGPRPGLGGPVWNASDFQTTLNRKMPASTPSSEARKPRLERNGILRSPHAHTGRSA